MPINSPPKPTRCSSVLGVSSTWSRPGRSTLPRGQKTGARTLNHISGNSGAGYTDCVEALLLRRGPAAAGLVDAMEILQVHREWPPLDRATFDDRFLYPEWRAGVVLPKEPHVYRFRQFETALFFEVVDALKGGDTTSPALPTTARLRMTISQSNRSLRRWPSSSRTEASRTSQGVCPWAPRATTAGSDLDGTAVGTDRTVVLRPDGKHIAPRLTGIEPPLSALRLAEAIQ